MSSSQRLRLWLVVGAASLAAGGIALGLILTSGHAGNRVVNAVLNPLISWSFAFSGLVAWSRRPENRTGRLLVAVSFAWLAPLLIDANDSVLYTIGQLSGSIVLAVFVQLLVAYPSGRLSTRLERTVVPAGYALALVANSSILLVDPSPFCPSHSTCPKNVFFVTRSATAASTLNVVWDLTAVALFALVGLALVRRWRRSTVAARRSLRAVLFVGAAVVLLLTLGFALDPISSHAKEVPTTLALLVFGTLPYFFLGGILGSRLARAGVAELLVGEMGTLDEAQEALQRALRDPDLRLGVWLPERRGYVDTAGDSFDVPEESGSRVVRLVESDQGGRLAAIVHDRTLLDEPELLEAVVAAARLSLHRNRLLAELRARLDELQRERDFIATVVNAAPTFFCVIDLEGGIVRFNDTLVAASGVADDERVRGRPFWEVFPVPDDAGAVEAVVRGAVPGEHEHRWRREDGGDVVVAWSVTPIADGQGQGRFIVTGLDVSERVRHEDELRREHDFLERVSQATATLLCAVHADGSVDRRGVNRAFAVATGIDDRVAIGRYFWDLVIPPEHVERVREAFLSAVASGSMTTIETAWKAADGGELTVEWFASSLEGYRDGHYLISGTDITKRKRDEDEVRRSRARLVEAADAERRRLERNLHDGAQQRLVSLSLALRLAEAKLPADPDAAAQILAGAGAELALALQELRELARGLHPAILTDRGLAAALEALAERAPFPVGLELELDGRLPGPVEAAVFYVVSEALTNVAKYAGASGANVRVDCDGARVAVEVADDGVGGADPAHGSGLRGLVDRVDALDGRVEVDSPRGGGTRVRAEVPLAAVREAAPPF